MGIKAARQAAKSVFSYISKCCGAQANKPPCEWEKEDRKEGKKSQSGLGSWRCSQCKKGCSVSRSARITPITTESQATAAAA